MTQILGAIIHGRVFHVSDRLLSRRTVNGAIPFDKNSNKTIIYCATDADVVAAYTGRAYLDHTPTDTFIAQSFRGAPLTDTVALLLGRSDAWTDIGRSVERLRADLSAAFLRLPERERRDDFQVSILGWRIRNTKSNRPMTPIVWELRRPVGQPNQPFEVSRGERWWPWHRGYVLCTTPDVPSDIVESIQRDMRLRGRHSLDGVKSVMIDGLRNCADSRPDTIGSACLQVVLDPWQAPQARIRFIADVRYPNQTPSGLLGFSPWIVTPQAVFAPALMRGSERGGGFTDRQTGWSWSHDSPIGPEGAHQYLHFPQPRPPDPQQRT